MEKKDLIEIFEGKKRLLILEEEDTTLEPAEQVLIQQKYFMKVSKNPVPEYFQNNFRVIFNQKKFFSLLSATFLCFIIYVISLIFYVDYNFVLIPKVQASSLIPDEFKPTGINILWFRIILQFICIGIIFIFIGITWTNRKKFTVWDIQLKDAVYLIIPFVYGVFLNFIQNWPPDLPQGYVYPLPTQEWRVPFIIATALSSSYFLGIYFAILCIANKYCVRITRPSAIILFSYWLMDIALNGLQLRKRGIGYNRVANRTFSYLLREFEVYLKEECNSKVINLSEIKQSFHSNLITKAKFSLTITESVKEDILLNFLNKDVFNRFEFLEMINSLSVALQCKEISLWEKIKTTIASIGKEIALIILSIAMSALFTL